MTTLPTIWSCVRDCYVRPAHPVTMKDLDDDDTVLVLETDLDIKPGQPCHDLRLEDLLIALEPMLKNAKDSDSHISAIEIRGRNTHPLHTPHNTLRPH